jgi:hypothetical protein
VLTLFALSLPGLVVLIIALGSFKLLRAKVTGQARPGAASVGMDLLDVLLKPGSEHRVAEHESQQLFRENSESGEPPFSVLEINGKKIRWKPPTKN